MLDIQDKDSGEKKAIPMLRLYRLFNLDQTTLNPSTTNDLEIVTAHTAEQIRENFQDKPDIYQHPQPHYNPVADKIGIPHKNDFNSEASYRATLFHE